jgi:hypothetical protein
VTVVFELIDAPYPHVCALYRCECGAEATCYGDEAGAPPPGWALDADGGETAEHVSCPRCTGSGQRPS